MSNLNIKQLGLTNSKSSQTLKNNFQELTLKETSEIVGGGNLNVGKQVALTIDNKGLVKRKPLKSQLSFNLGDDDLSATINSDKDLVNTNYSN